MCHPLPSPQLVAGLQNTVLFNEADIFMYFSVSDSRGQFTPGSASLPLTTQVKTANSDFVKKKTKHHHPCLLFRLCSHPFFFTFAFDSSAPGALGNEDNETELLLALLWSLLKTK